MLDSETKRRIDTARDILVGKLPDPKSQVEQITIALIYKFMDDMDAQSVEYGGEPSFFVGDYEKYGWRKIFSPAIGGFEMLNLYGEAITSLNQNPNLPQLFRDVFKNAFLPYRDPETLKLFLKTINEFQYDHSERLGDAFEYLLSVLGSQGDAGQFRTPRHIIDFIVEVVQPRKDETVCDPACGTAGFLISSYKHILKANMRKTPGDLLTPDERKKLIANFVGYDISPDMVRLSLVNMYLHGFPDPHIYEYDTLTSEDRWHEYFDVIMANPPFMSPKGGIKPHKKFSLQANRSEVLFADYIAEHINPVSGRAGMIVPEGVIFQGANAYKDLRKMLVEKNYLYAVVSLPAGVFQPYSGVKTSILFFDKTLASKTSKILFVKISNDGYGLGAQRKELNTSDLPDALNIILDFQKTILSGETSGSADGNLCLSAFAVEKSTVSANGDYNLSADRYRISEKQHHKFKMVELGEIVKSTQLGLVKSKSEQGVSKDGFQIPYIKMDCITMNGNLDLKKVVYVKATEEEIEKYTLDDGDFIYNTRNSPDLVGKSSVYHGLNRQFLFNNNILRIKFDEQAMPDYVNSILNSQFGKKQIRSLVAGTTSVAAIYQKEFLTIKIPFPPLSVQKETVERIEGYQHLIDGAKQVIASFKPNININPDWKMVELDEACKFIDYRGKTPQKTDRGIRLITAKNVRIGYLSYEPVEFIAEEDYDNWMTRGFVKKGDVLITTEAPLGNVAQIDTDEKIALAQRIIALIPKTQSLDRAFLKNVLLTNGVQRKIQNHATGSTVYGIKASTLKTITIPLPMLEEQKQIVAQIEREQSLVNANKELITIYEQKIKDEINKLWEE